MKIRDNVVLETPPRHKIMSKGESLVQTLFLCVL